MPRVLNKRTAGVPTGAIYVGRPSKWGNPFTHLERSVARCRVRTREEAVTAYRDWLISAPEAAALRASLPELRGRDLVCWCAPLACHASVLVQLANA